MADESKHPGQSEDAGNSTAASQSPTIEAQLAEKAHKPPFPCPGNRRSGGCCGLWLIGGPGRNGPRLCQTGDGREHKHSVQTGLGHFASWCRRRGADQFTPDPRLIGLYITEMAAPQDGSPALAVSTIERRLSGLSWNYQQRGQRLDRQDRHIATVLAGILNKHGRSDLPGSCARAMAALCQDRSRSDLQACYERQWRRPG